jgi:hypothetical protein
VQVILSPHNFGRYLLDRKSSLIGTAGVPVKAFVDFSYKVAKAFAGNDAIYALSLMNEPQTACGSKLRKPGSMRFERSIASGWFSLPRSMEWSLVLATL